MIEVVLEAWGIKNAEIKVFGNGLIHRTWKVITSGGEYILQKVHHGVFKRPEDIAYNVRLIGDYLKEKFPDYFFVRSDFLFGRK